MVHVPLVLAGSAGAIGGCLLLLVRRRRLRRGRAEARAAESGKTSGRAESASRAAVSTPLGARLRPSSEGYSISVGLMREVVRGLHELPPFPPALMLVLQELDEAGSSAQSVAEIIAREPTLAAMLLRLTNSAAFGLQREIATICEAVAYLGFATTKALFLRLKIGTLFPPAGGRGSYDAAKLWSHSVAVAQIAEELARRVGNTDPHLALAGGLLHDIGKMAINAQFPAAVRELWSPASVDESFLSRERRLFGADHAAIGAHLAEQWRLPRNLVEMIRLHHLPPNQPVHLKAPVRRSLYAVFVANQIVKYCHVYCSRMEIDPIPEAVSEELRIPAQAEKLLDEAMRKRVRLAVSLSRRAATSAPGRAAA